MPKPTFFNLPAAKRQRITELAVEEFATHPYRQASLSNIVARAGIAKGSIYQYFEDKQDLYRWLVLDVAYEQQVAHIRAYVQATPADFYVYLQQVTLAALRFYSQFPRLGRLLAGVLELSADPELAPLCKQVRQQSYQWCCSVLEQAIQHGHVRSDLKIDVAAHLVTAALGEGMTYLLLDRLNTDLGTALHHPERIEKISETVLEALVEDTVSILQRGLHP